MSSDNSTVAAEAAAAAAPETNNYTEPNVGIAFALVIGAGAATAVGASAVFFPRLVKLASRKTLAGALGLSAGVMTYVSFVEIFQKSVGAFEAAGYSADREGYIYATVCFFGGVVLMVVSSCSVLLLCELSLLSPRIVRYVLPNPPSPFKLTLYLNSIIVRTRP